ncbi:MAG: DUF134 domain-containing protein [Nitrososphaeria archaeon]
MCPCWCRRRRRGVAGRIPKPIIASSIPVIESFKPFPSKNIEPVYLDLAEVEALKLIELEKLSCQEAGARMNVSRNTVWRLVEEAREKLTRAIVEGREIIILKDDSLQEKSMDKI